jgi:hypothetical protein
MILLARTTPPAEAKKKSEDMSILIVGPNQAAAVAAMQSRRVSPGR